MADSGFVYKANESKGEYLVFNSSSDYDSEFDYIRNLLEGVDFFTDSLDLKIYPEGYPDSDFEVLVRSRPNKAGFLLPAAIFDADFELVSFLLVERKNYQRAILISKNKDVLADIHGNFLFEETLDGETISYSMREFVQEATDPGHDMGLVRGVTVAPASLVQSLPPEPKAKPSALKKELSKPHKVEQEEETEEYVQPELDRYIAPVSNPKKKMKRILLPEEEEKQRKKAEPKPTTAKPAVAKPVQEVPTAPQPQVQRSPFEATKKRDFRKPIPDPIEPKTKEIPAKPAPKVENPVQMPALEKSFSAVSKKKIKDLSRIPSSFFSNLWKSVDSINFVPDYDRGRPRLAINCANGEYAYDLSFYLKSEFKKPFHVEPHKNCNFAPVAPEPDDELPNILTTCSLQRFYFLAAFLDPYGKPYSYLIALKEDPDIAAILVKGRYQYFIFAVSSIGIYIPMLKLSSSDLLSRCYPEDFPSEEEEIGEEPAKKEEEKPIAPKAESVPPAKKVAPASEKKEEKRAISAKDPRRENAVERRKIYYTPHFKAKFDAFLKDHQAKGQKDFDDFLFNLQTLKDDELEQFFARKHVKRIQCFKMHLSNDSEYAASRIFYLTADQFENLGRRIEPRSMVLFAFSTQQEHDIQEEIEAKGYAALRRNSTILCFPAPTTAKEEEKLYVLSSDQNKYLEKSTSELPAAVLGSAGSGKTLMSYQAYLELCSSMEEKVLYVTYEKKLKEKASAAFEEMGAKNATVLTFKELMKVIHVSAGQLKPQFKNNFHEWFFSRKEKDFILRANLISPNKEDAFSTAYVFYRGVIEGSLKNLQKKGKASKILTREEFKDEIESEYGLTLEQKEAIYDIALAYEKHLKDIGGITDNKYALRLIEEEKREVFDAIVVDEYQDLTELQLYAIAKVLKDSKPHKLLLFGDDNQAVNPTILNITGLNKVLYEAFGEKINYVSLKTTYRTGKALFTYIVDVLRIKDQAIGADRGENTAPVSTYRDDEQDLYITLLQDPTHFETLLLAAKNSKIDVVFIFPSAAKRDQAKKKYASLLNDNAFLSDNFLSVEGSKGREWDSCVLVDFISSSKDIFEAMLGEERAGHRSTVHRMLFNRYYVALTRAENRIVVYESNAGPLAKKRLLSQLTELKGKSDIEKIFTGNSDPRYWIDHGDELFVRGKYEEAYRAYRRGSQDEESESRQQMARAYIKAYEAEKLSQEAVDLFIRYEDIESLSRHYEKVNAPKRKRLLDTFRDMDATTATKQEAYRKALPILYDSERVLFFRELCLLRKEEILGILDKMEDK